MPELPEVQTTVDGINQTVKNLVITDVWTNYKSPYYKNKEEIKNPSYFTIFAKEIKGQKILSSERRAKNILIHLSNKKTLLIHMKMTGHLMYGSYTHSKEPKDIKDPWNPTQKTGPLADPFNRHIRLVFSLSNNKHLVLSDMRKFAKVTLIDTETLLRSPHISHLGPEPLDSTCNTSVFYEQIQKRTKEKLKLY